MEKSWTYYRNILNIHDNCYYCTIAIEQDDISQPLVGTPPIRGFHSLGFFTRLITINKYANRWQAYWRGAIAEEFVGKILENLPQDYLVLNDIQLGYGNIDHFVIGKNGCLYMIETKSHRGKVTIEGDQIRINNKRTEKEFIKQTHRNAYDVRDEIASILGVSLNVTPVLVFTNAFCSIQSEH